jgi:23S rRNA (guanosine2251-2'-O)-methyltransferase
MFSVTFITDIISIWMKGRSRHFSRYSPLTHSPRARPSAGPDALFKKVPPGQNRLQSATPEIIFGVEPVREMMVAAPSAIRTLYVKQGSERRFDEQIKTTRDWGGKIVSVTNSDLARLAGSDARHQGIAATIRSYNYATLEHLLAPKPDPVLLLDGVTDPRNLGAIIRTAECAGIDAIVVAKDRTVGVTPAAIKSSAGAWAHVRVARCGNVAQTIERLKTVGYWIAALDPRGETSVYELDATRQLALVLGAEGAGIREIVRKTADLVVRIPLHGRLSSLNVSTAAAVALFEIVRRRTQPPTTEARRALGAKC